MMLILIPFYQGLSSQYLASNCINQQMDQILLHDIGHSLLQHCNSRKVFDMGQMYILDHHLHNLGIFLEFCFFLKLIIDFLLNKLHTFLEFRRQVEHLSKLFILLLLFFHLPLMVLIFIR
jgi:hypothetical protein